MDEREQTCVDFLQARKTFRELDLRKIKPEAMIAAENALIVARVALKALVRRQGGRLAITGWRFSLDRNDDLHVCQAPESARTLPPFLLGRRVMGVRCSRSTIS